MNLCPKCCLKVPRFNLYSLENNILVVIRMYLVKFGTLNKFSHDKPSIKISSPYCNYLF